MSRSEPKQKRSRDRVEKILRASGELLAKTGSAEELTTTTVAKRAGVPVATVYRYFANRTAIIGELIDRELEDFNVVINAELQKLDTITIRSLYETIMYAHLDYFQKHRSYVVLWFGTRGSDAVLERVDRRYRRMAEWLTRVTIETGMAKPDVPPWGMNFIVWLSDRSFEFMFRERRTDEEQIEIMREFLTMACGYLEEVYATPVGIEGLPRDQVLAQAGPFDA